MCSQSKLEHRSITEMCLSEDIAKWTAQGPEGGTGYVDLEDTPFLFRYEITFVSWWCHIQSIFRVEWQQYSSIASTLSQTTITVKCKERIHLYWSYCLQYSLDNYYSKILGSTVVLCKDMYNLYYLVGYTFFVFNSN